MEEIKKGLIAMYINAYMLAERFVGIKEVSGSVDNPQILAMLRLDNDWPKNDETPWCSAFLNYIVWLLALRRSKSLLARSWLKVGFPMKLADAVIGFDICILKRGDGEQPGPNNYTAPGHVGFYAGKDENSVYLLGGNQGNAVSVQKFPIERLLGIRRLA